MKSEWHGGMDPDCRACMIWDEKEQDLELFRYVQQLIHLRKTDPVFSNGGKFRFVTVDNELIVLFMKNLMKIKASFLF